jgi:hypothetical protein
VPTLLASFKRFTVQYRPEGRGFAGQHGAAFTPKVPKNKKIFKNFNRKVEEVEEGRSRKDQLIRLCGSFFFKITVFMR